MSDLSWREFAAPLRWLDGRPLLETIEPYRASIFDAVLGTGRYSMVLTGRGKKNWKSADLDLAGLYCLSTDAPTGHDSECYILANDEDQASDDLDLAKKLIRANPVLSDWLSIKRREIERRDGRGFLAVLPANDVLGSHGKQYRFCGWDEIHGYKNWDIFEALQPDPRRTDVLQWITSYASLFHRPGAPLFDLTQIGRLGGDPRMFFSWYAADYTTDPAVQDATPEVRANPSMASWGNTEYLDQQRRRLPAHKYRRLHLNLPGLPEGSAYQAEPVMDAVARGVPRRAQESGVTYGAFCDMSGGSNDDATLCIGHRDLSGRVIVDVLLDHGPPPPFDPRKAIDRFVVVLREYGLNRVTGDRYAGETFKCDFEARGVHYDVSPWTKSELYEALEPQLNAREVMLVDVPKLEQQLLGLVWRGGRIDHPAGEHDDFANAAAGVAKVLCQAPSGFRVIPLRDPQQRFASFGRRIP